MMSPICDLVLLSWNHLEQTKPCLETLFQSTTVLSRLIIVDNGSEPDVRTFLQSVRPRGAIRQVVLLQNEKNEGFPHGMNCGIRASQAPFVCLLNNDLRFPSGWLEEMIDVARTHPEVGVVNPASNTFGTMPPPGTSLERFATGLAVLRGRYTEVGMCIGFCMLVKREVLDRIGGLNEEVERIFFEDEDFCMRVSRAGFQCVIASGSYVYHAEHQTVRNMPEREALFARNQRWCHERWGRWVRIAWPRFQPVRPGSDELRRWLTRLIAMARRRAHIYVYSPTPPGLDADALFRSVGLVPHADVRWHVISSMMAPLAAVGRILGRRKKPFDIIAAPDDGWGQKMRLLSWLHRAVVVPQDDEEQLAVQWQQKSRSL